MARLRRTVLMAVATLAVAAPAQALASPSATPTFPSYGSFRDVLPPGANGLDNLAQLGLFKATGQRPAHSQDQLYPYATLVRAVPGLRATQIPLYYKDSSFGVRPGGVESVEHPGGRSDVTLVRDKAKGVPHVYATTRAGLEYGAGYAAAEDRLFFMDVLRHVGRAQLSSFAGGAPGNRAMDEAQWRAGPYTESDLTLQWNRLSTLYGADGRQVQQDGLNYIAGINQYVHEAQLDPTKMPGEYAAIGKPLRAFKPTDIIATATLIGATFGVGGGQELTWAQLLQGFQRRFGAGQGHRLWADFRSAEDPEAPTTIHNGARFPYQVTPRHVRAGTVALPDRGSVRRSPTVVSKSGSAAATASAGPGLRGLLAFPSANSNALLISGKLSRSHRPFAVFGPQVAYFSPQILMEEDLHGPGIDARGAAFPGVSLYVELGHGKDYAWSATSAGQDIVDTYAVDLCNPNGGRVSTTSNYYRFRGQCLKMDDLVRKNSWTPNAADQTPPGSETLRVQRTKLGLVEGRARIGGRPVAYTKLRSTYFHEVDSALGFKDFNDPGKVHDARSFQHAASKIGYTFNWFYTDNRDIAYFNSGNNPVRPAGLDPNLPVRASRATEWRGYDPRLNTARYTPFAAHPQVINQDYLTSWNNKQAPGFAGADTNVFSSLFRSDMLDEALNRATHDGRRRISPVDLIAAMESAATVDLRGDDVLPWALRVLTARTPPPRHRGRHPIGFTGAAPPSARYSPAVRHAIDGLRRWQHAGAHRRDLKGSPSYEYAGTIKTMDAWWPRWIRAQFEPALGADLYRQLTSVDAIDNSPNSDPGSGFHLGSAYQTGFYGFAQKDLRAVLGRRVRGRFARGFCGAGRNRQQGSVASCRAVLARSLAAAVTRRYPQVYHDPSGICEAAHKDGDQQCFDSISFRPLGAITQPLLAWQNRPTYQQVVALRTHRRR